MDIHVEKLRLIEWMAGLTDPGIIKEFVALKQSKELDWWDEISEEEKAEIEEGIAQADKGELVPHDQVMAKYKKWL